MSPAYFLLLMTVPHMPGLEKSDDPLNGSELVDNYFRIEFRDTINEVHFPTRELAILKSDNGVVSFANWRASAGKICLTLENGRSECWPYLHKFSPNKSVILVSECGVSSRWTLRPSTQ